MLRLAATVLVACTSAVAGAQSTTVLCESHARERPARADEYLEAMQEGLGTDVPIRGPALEALSADKISRSAGSGDRALVGVVRNQVYDVQDAFATARFADAVARMEWLRALLLGRAAAVAGNPPLRALLFEGTVVMLKALLRLGRQGDAESLAIELYRSFPDMAVTERDHGPQVAEFASLVRRQSLPRARFVLHVGTSPGGAAVFLNERYVGNSPVHVPDVMPGRYRVMARAGEVQGRVHTVTVLEDSVDLRIDLAFDQALGPWGFLFTDDGDRARREPSYALRLARALGAREVIAVGLGGHADRPLWIATVYNVESGGVLRSAAVALAPASPSRPLLVSLGRFLRGGEAAEGLIVKQDRSGAGPLSAMEAGERRGRGGRRVWAYVGLAGAAALIAAGSYLLYLDGRGTCDLQPGQERCPENHKTLAEGVGLLVGGGVLAAAAGALLYLDLRRARVGVAVGPRGAAGLAWVRGTF